MTLRRNVVPLVVLITYSISNPANKFKAIMLHQALENGGLSAVCRPV